MIFDGKAHAKQKEEELSIKASALRMQNITPKLVAIQIGDSPASSLYLSLKKKVAERIGVSLEVAKFDKNTNSQIISELIKQLSMDRLVHGIMVQLPFPETYSEEDRKKIILSIKLDKDVDGLRFESPYLPAAVKAVFEILYSAGLDITKKVCIVGSEGFVGRALLKSFEERGFSVLGVDKKLGPIKLKVLRSDIIISATGEPSVIKADMIKKGALVIDVGSPRGDVDFEEVAKKASFITPVPGGVGPVTIVCLFENLIDSASTV